MEPTQNRAGRLLTYLAEVMVNGATTPLPTDLRSPYMKVEAPKTPYGKNDDDDDDDDDADVDGGDDDDDDAVVVMMMMWQ